MRLLKKVLSFALDFFLFYAKMTLTHVLGKKYCFVNKFDLSKIKYFDVP